MTDERGSSPLALAIREVPGIAIASIGFGCALLAIEGDRLSTIRTVNISGDYHAVASLVSFLLLIMLALAYRKLDAPTHVPAAIVIGAGALMSASMFVVLQQSVWEDNPIVSSIARIVFGLGEGVILFLWMKALFPYGARACAAVLGLGTIVVAAMNSLIAFLKVDAAYGTVSLLPIVSMVLLCYFREYARSRAPRADRDDIPSEDACASPERSMVAGIGCPDRSLIVPSDQAPRGRRVFVVTMMLSLACYAVVFGHIHYQWIPLQDGGTVSLIIQLGTAVGTACGGAAILVLVQYFWNRRSLELYKVFLIPTVLLALWLSSFVNETWIFLYLVLLNITQKLVFLFIMLAPFLIESKRPYLMPWCVAFLSFTASPREQAAERVPCAHRPVPADGARGGDPRIAGTRPHRAAYRGHARHHAVHREDPPSQHLCEDGRPQPAGDPQSGRADHRRAEEGMSMLHSHYPCNRSSFSLRKNVETLTPSRAAASSASSSRAS